MDGRERTYMSTPKYHTSEAKAKWVVTVACNESCKSCEARVPYTPLATNLVYSPKDEPHLRDLENLVSAIPETTLCVAFEDVNALFPPDETNKDRSDAFVLEFVARIRQKTQAFYVVDRRRDRRGRSSMTVFDLRPGV